MKKIIPVDQLSKLLITHYSLLITILATGCFDILHKEHKKFLKAAKKQGDVLMVGLESDKRVRMLKGKDRPVNIWEIRARNLAKLNVIDFVFPLPNKFDRPQEHLKLVQLIRPNILAVSENTPHIKAKSKLMKKIGGRLKIVLPHNPKISTTRLLKKNQRGS